MPPVEAVGKVQLSCGCTLYMLSIAPKTAAGSCVRHLAIRAIKQDAHALVLSNNSKLTDPATMMRHTAAVDTHMWRT
jgi:hypothetical protein